MVMCIKVNATDEERGGGIKEEAAKEEGGEKKLASLLDVSCISFPLVYVP